MIIIVISYLSAAGALNHFFWYMHRRHCPRKHARGGHPWNWRLFIPTGILYLRWLERPPTAVADEVRGAAPWDAL